MFTLLETKVLTGYPANTQRETRELMITGEPGEDLISATGGATHTL